MENNCKYWLGITIYEDKKVFPRKLAQENKDFLKDGLAVAENGGYVYLIPGKRILEKQFWYQENGIWKKAEWTGKMWQLPGRAFEQFESGQEKIGSASLVIALTVSDRQPADEEKRILTVHFLKQKYAEREGMHHGME